MAESKKNEKPQEQPKEVQTQEQPKEVQAQEQPREETAPAPLAGKGWDDMYDYAAPKARAGEEKTIYVWINGKSYGVPCGKTSRVPYPVYERLRLRENALDEEEETRNSIPNQLSGK